MKARLPAAPPFPIYCLLSFCRLLAAGSGRYANMLLSRGAHHNPPPALQQPTPALPKVGAAKEMCKRLSYMLAFSGPVLQGINNMNVNGDSGSEDGLHSGPHTVAHGEPPERIGPRSSSCAPASEIRWGGYTPLCSGHCSGEYMSEKLCKEEKM